jgi:hypothetical protein
MVVRSKVSIAPALLGGLGAALILLAMPVGLVETVVASSGLSEVWSAAAPPLGLKARLMLVAFGALMAMGFVWANHRERGVAPKRMQGYGRRTGVQGVTIMGFALSKLSWLSRSRGAGSSRGGRPALRRADAHPDAPARAPIFASRDFGGLDIFPKVAPGRASQVEEAQAEQPVARPLPAMSSPPVQSMIDGEFEEVVEPAAPAARSAEPAPRAPLTISELTARLERGLAQRVRTAPSTGSTSGVLADMPVEPAVPVRKQVDHDVDQALRSALGALRAMAERTR